MTSILPFEYKHLLQYNSVNVDRLTETYSPSFYGRYLTSWCEYQRTCVHGPTGTIMGYMLGKVEGEGEDWHGHVSAVSIAPPFRRTGLGGQMMDALEETTSTLHNAFFVDLFVRKGNTIAQDMYRKLGYVCYRTVNRYYSATKQAEAEDARDLRKALPRNARRSKSCHEDHHAGKTIRQEDLEWQ